MSYLVAWLYQLSNPFLLHGNKLKSNYWNIAACDDEKAIWQSFILSPSLLISRRETIHMFRSCSLLAESAIRFYYPWVELLRTRKWKVKSMSFFLDKEGQDSGVWYLKEFCLGAVQLVVPGCRWYFLGNLWHTWQQHFILYSLNDSSVQSLPWLFLSTEILLRFIYILSLCVIEMMDDNYRCFQPDWWHNHRSARRTIPEVGGESQFFLFSV